MARRKVVAPLAGASEAPDPALQSAREAVAEQLIRRQRLPRAVRALEDTLFPSQRAFVMDEAPRVVASSTRRAGKTHGLGARILRVARLFPGETLPVFERTQTCEAARVLWKALQDLDKAFGLGCEFHHSRLICRLPNRTEIVIMGADTAEACDKARGGRYPAAFVDEAGTFRHHILDYLLKEVLGPALLDFRGTLTMTGTPTPRRQGPFFEACMSAEWSHHRWTYLDNDALPLGHERVTSAERRAMREQDLADAIRRSGLTVDSPRIQREFFGEWVEDNQSNVYQLREFNYRHVRAPDLTTPGWRYTIGLDVGWNDPCAFVVLAWRRNEPDLWVVESFQHQRLFGDQVAAHLERLLARYPRAAIYMDAGGHGGKIIEQELIQRHGIRVIASRKRGKFDHIAFLNSDLLNGRIKVVEVSNQDLIADMLTLRYAPPAPDGTQADAEHPSDDNHLPDALLYAWTGVRSLRKGLPDADGPDAGSAAWEAARERTLEAADVRAHRSRGVDDSTIGAALALLP